MSVPATIFKGTAAETTRLLAVIERNCECKRNIAGQIVKNGVCGSHLLLLDQHFLDWGLFYLRTREAVLRREWADAGLSDYGF
jgi:hypothetical protein